MPKWRSAPGGQRNLDLSSSSSVIITKSCLYRYLQASRFFFWSNGNTLKKSSQSLTYAVFMGNPSSDYYVKCGIPVVHCHTFLCRNELWERFLSSERRSTMSFIKKDKHISYICLVERWAFAWLIAKDNKTSTPTCSNAMSLKIVHDLIIYDNNTSTVCSMLVGDLTNA